MALLAYQRGEDEGDPELPEVGALLIAEALSILRAFATAMSKRKDGGAP